MILNFLNCPTFEFTIVFAHLDNRVMLVGRHVLSYRCRQLGIAFFDRLDINHNGVLVRLTELLCSYPPFVPDPAAGRFHTHSVATTSRRVFWRERYL